MFTSVQFLSTTSLGYFTWPALLIFLLEWGVSDNPDRPANPGVFRAAKHGG
jgi:hypothetical protein